MGVGVHVSALGQTLDGCSRDKMAESWLLYNGSIKRYPEESPALHMFLTSNVEKQSNSPLIIWINRPC